MLAMWIGSNYFKCIRRSLRLLPVTEAGEWGKGVCGGRERERERERGGEGGREGGGREGGREGEGSNCIVNGLLTWLR